MRLSTEQIVILQAIHDSKNHYLEKIDIAKLRIDFPDIEDDLQVFINNDLIEYELEEDRYYLSYDGFEILKPKRTKPVIRKSNTQEYTKIMDSLGGSKHFHRFTLKFTLACAILLSIIYCFSQKATYQKESTPKNDQTISKELNQQSQELTDSIQE